MLIEKFVCRTAMSVERVYGGKGDSSVIQKVVKELHLSQMSCFLFRRKNSALKLGIHEPATSNLYVRAHTSGNEHKKNIQTKQNTANDRIFRDSQPEKTEIFNTKHIP